MLQYPVGIPKKERRMEPIVSVITTTHNIVEKGQTDDFNLLISLLDRQTYNNIEHIIIDNASTDGTTELLRNYKNKGYLTFVTERDTGKFEAYNKGIIRSKGTYVSFLSCDDFYHDITAITDVVNLMEAEQADFCFSPAYCRHPQGFTFLFEPAIYNVFQVMPCARQGMFFKKTMLEKERYFDEKFKVMADYDLIIRIMMKKYKGIYFPSNFTTYKLGEKAFENQERCTEETKMIYMKNYRNLYPLNNAMLTNMVNISDFPRQLLEQLAQFFPPQDKEHFIDSCEQMHKLRVEAMQQQPR